MSATTTDVAGEEAIADDELKYRRISARFYGLLVSVVVVAFLSWLLGYPALALVALAPIPLILIAALLMGRRPGGYITRQVEPAQLTRGDRATTVLLAENRGITPTGAAEAVDLIAGREVALAMPAIPPRRTVEVSYTFVPTRRGKLTLGPVTLERRDPWGLFVRRASLSKTTTLLIHPRVLPVSAGSIGRRHGMDGGMDREALGSNQFHTLRDYVVGDELRQIHWRSSARVGKLMVKQLVDNPLPRALIVIDVDEASYPSPRGNYDAFEEGIDVAASLASAIANSGLQLVVRTNAEDHPTEVLRPEDFPQILDNLAVISKRRLKVRSELKTLISSARATSLYLVSGSTSPHLSTVIGALGSVGEATLIRVGNRAPASSPRRGLHVYDVATAEDLVPPEMRHLL